jgi:hypothetical protein
LRVGQAQLSIYHRFAVGIEPARTPSDSMGVKGISMKRFSERDAVIIADRRNERISRDSDIGYTEAVWRQPL